MKTLKATMFLLAIGFVLVLGGCSGTILVPVPGRTVPTLSSGENYVADLDPLTLRVLPGATRTLHFDLTTANANGVYFVIDEGDLRVRTPGFSTYASSSTGYFFASGEDGILPALVGSSDLAPQALPTTRTSCLGPCVILDEAQVAGLPNAFVQIANPFTVEITVDLWVFSQALDDSTEPGNDTLTGAEALPSGSSLGAIETLGDADFYEALADGSVTVYAPLTSGAPAENFLTIEAELFNHAGISVDGGLVGGANPVTIAPDGSHTFTNVFSGDFVRVHAVDDDRAAAAQYSRYEVQLTP